MFSEFINMSLVCIGVYSICWLIAGVTLGIAKFLINLKESKKERKNEL